jgi:hypothetical protein
MDFGSEKNDWGQNLWWGLHLISPVYLRWDDWKIRAYQVYDNQLKFLNEARDQQDWYFVFRAVVEIPEGGKTAYFKYVPFKLLNKDDQEKFRIWEWRHGIKKINPEPGEKEKCIHRDDFLNFKKEQLIVRYHELMSEPPERDYEADQKIIDARNLLQVQLRDLFKDNQYGLRLIGTVSPFAEYQGETYGNLKFDPSKEDSLKMVVDFLDGEPGDLDRLQRLIGSEVGKPVSLIPWADFKNKALLDMQLTILRRGPERWDVISNPAHFEKDWESLNAKKN